MNIIFMGSPDFAIPSLEKISNSEFNLKAVVSNVDKRRGRGSSVAPTPVKEKAEQLGVPVIEVDDLNDPAFAEQLASLQADIFVVVAFRILPKNILEIPKIGSINLHASLLPKYRGAAPIHWAVINGEEETGCTIFFLDEKVDTGKIILQKKTLIDDNETTGEVYSRLMDMGSDALLEAMYLIESGSHTEVTQDDALATPAPKLFRETCHIDFEKPAREVHNKIRGLSPFPTAWANLDGEKFNLYRSRLGPIANIDPGELLVRGDKLLVGCGDGTVELLEIQLPGKKRMETKNFLAGNTLEGTLK
ncbi:MAG: methionyl-tRNA formyltransferase [Balneola sp.]|nr:MAG: methionyl-tRNA formyltransferase [Balneola sp.]